MGKAVFGPFLSTNKSTGFLSDLNGNMGLLTLSTMATTTMKEIYIQIQLPNQLWITKTHQQIRLSSPNSKEINSSLPLDN